jgi:hypothetical protein
MVNFNAWRGSHTTAISDADRAVSLWGIIQRDPTSIQFRRDGTLLSAQSVRIESDNIVSEKGNPNGSTAQGNIVVYGIADHPTVTDTDMQRDDRFWLDNVEYEITDVVRTPGQVQGMGVRVS